MSIPQIDALITLIDDPDPAIFSQVEQELVSIGEDVLPELERFWEVNQYGELFQERVEHLIRSIQYDSIFKQLRNWRDDENNDLLEGAILINRYQYPSFDEEEVRYIVSKIRQDIWLELNDNLTALEIVNIFNHIIYKVHGFSGNKNNYSAPQNSFIADVLTTKKGNPLSLVMLYRILASSLEVPIYGVNLPNHFILTYVDETLVNSQDNSEDQGVLFYINPFTDGTVIHRNEVDEFLFHLDLPQKVGYYRPCSNNEIIARMINNLIYSYSQLGKDEKVDELKKLQKVFQ
jgi:regulator of sirC expression with transglutaminase-like and TPR domain